MQINLAGYNAHVVKNLVGINGRNKEEVPEFILNSWVGSNHAKLGEIGINIEEARRQGYLSKSKKE